MIYCLFRILIYGHDFVVSEDTEQLLNCDRHAPNGLPKIFLDRDFCGTN